MSLNVINALDVIYFSPIAHNVNKGLKSNKILEDVTV